MFDFVNLFMFLGLLILLMEKIPQERTISETSQILSKIEGQS